MRGSTTPRATAYIGASTGLPGRNVFTVAGVGSQGTSEMGTSTVDFYDYGAKIAIALPADGRTRTRNEGRRPALPSLANSGRGDDPAG